MSRKATSATRTKTIVRSAKTGRFVKASTAKRSSHAVKTEELTVTASSVEVARSASTGRFVKKDTARRHPDKTVVQRLKR